MPFPSSWLCSAEEVISLLIYTSTVSRDDLLVRHGTTSFSDAFIDEGERSRARARRSQSGPGFFASQISESESLSKQYYTNHKLPNHPSNGWGRLMYLSRKSAGMGSGSQKSSSSSTTEDAAATRFRSARDKSTPESSFAVRAAARRFNRPGDEGPSLAWRPQYRRCSNRIFDSPLFDERPRRRRRRCRRGA